MMLAQNSVMNRSLRSSPGLVGSTTKSVQWDSTSRRSKCISPVTTTVGCVSTHSSESIYLVIFLPPKKEEVRESRHKSQTRGRVENVCYFVYLNRSKV